MNELMTIENVRGYIGEDGTAYLNLEDVSRGLGFTEIAKSGNECVKWSRVRKYLSDFNFIDTSGDGFIPENIFYRLAMKAKNETAECFQIKVADEILPSIRKHGAYMTPLTIDTVLKNPDLLIKLATQLKEEQQARKKAEQTNAILMHVNKTYTMTEIAKELNMKSAIELNKKLSNMKIQFKQNNTWVLYSKYADCGYEEIKQEVLDNGKVIYHRKITQMGREFILNLFKGKK